MQTTRDPKTVTTFWVKDCPIISNHAGQLAGSVKIELIAYPEKCKIHVTGRKLAGGKLMTLTLVFNISGYPTHSGPPEWLIDFIANNSPTALGGGI